MAEHADIEAVLKIAGPVKWEDCHGDTRVLTHYPVADLWVEEPGACLDPSMRMHYPVAVFTAHAMIEKHLREWLAKRGRLNLYDGDSGDTWRRYATGPAEWGEENRVYPEPFGPPRTYSSYLDALIAAVLEVGKTE